MKNTLTLTFFFLLTLNFLFPCFFILKHCTACKSYLMTSELQGMNWLLID